MDTFTKVRNSAYMVVGSVATFIGFRSLVHHQYAFYYHKGQRWEPTLVLALMGVWLFFFGLIGFVRRQPRE